MRSAEEPTVPALWPGDGHHAMWHHTPALQGRTGSEQCKLRNTWLVTVKQCSRQLLSGEGDSLEAGDLQRVPRQPCVGGASLDRGAGYGVLVEDDLQQALIGEDSRVA